MNWNRIRKIGTSLLLLFTLTVLISPAASGDPAQQSVDSIQGAANSAGDPDKSGIGMLRQVFGGIVDNPLSPASSGSAASKNVPDPSILGNVFGVINMSILAIGAIFLTYSISAGVAQTAQDGEFLGRRFSSLWIPIRLVSGVTTLVPVFHGWALAQLVILWFSVLGVGIGNLATTEVSTWMAKGNSITVHRAAPDSVGLVDAVYKMNLCMSGLNADLAPPIFSRSTAPAVIAGGQNLGDVYYYGKGGQDATCGIISVPRPADSAVSGAPEAQASVQMAAAAYQAIDNAAKTKTDAFIQSIKDSSVDGKGGGSIHVFCK